VQPVSEDSTSDNEFDWLDEIEEEPDPTNQRRVGKNGGRSSVIEPLPRRIALEIIARWLWFIAAVELFCATICIVLGILAIAGRSHLWLMLIASGVSGIFSGLIFLAMSELLSMARGIESRLHEISKNISI